MTAGRQRQGAQAGRRPEPPRRPARPVRRRGRRRAAAWWMAGGAALLLVAVALVWAFVYAPFRQEQIYPLDYVEELRAAAAEFSLDPCLVAGLVYCESSFQADAESDVGAVGLTQIMPETGRWLAGKLGIEDYTPEMLLDPSTNLRMGCWYLRFLLDRYDGQHQEALTAYIAGQGQVDEWLKDETLSADGKTLDQIPGQDVKEYAAKVMRMYEEYRQAYGDVLGCGDAALESDGL